MSTKSSPWTNRYVPRGHVCSSLISVRLHATYTRLIPSVDVSSAQHLACKVPQRSPIQIEILPAGEEGPRRLDGTTVMTLAGIPVLTYSEFIRAKLKSWVL